MAVTTTPRLGIYRWSAATDEFNRTQMDASHASLESVAAMFLAGTIAARPAASAAYARSFYLATNENPPVGILYYCDGSTWQALNNVATQALGPPVALVVGGSNVAGTSSALARSDHIHALPPYGVVGEVVATGTSAAAGTADKFARIDHRHTIGAGSVVAGSIATGGVSASNQIANAIIQSYHFAPGAIETGSISPDARIPVGAIVPYTGTTAPTGWLMADGASYATASYSALFGLIGYRYGGSGANFNVPNLVNRLPRGATAFTSDTGFGLTGGADSVTLSAAQLPSHTHSIDHNHGSVTSGAQSNDHTHTINHTHGAFTTGTESVGHTHSIEHDHGSVTSGGASVDHTHSGTTVGAGDHAHSGTTNPTRVEVNQGVNVPSGFGGFITSTTHATIGSGSNIYDHSHSFGTNTTGSHTHTFSTGGQSATHTHSVDLPNFTGTSGGQSASHTHSVTVGAFSGTSGNTSAGHTHSVDLPNFTGTSGSVGSGSSIDIRDRFITLSYIIKV